MLLAACITFAFLCAASLLFMGNGLKDAAKGVASASPLLFVALCYTTFKCLPACGGRRLRIAVGYSLCLCAMAVVAAGYMMNNTFVANPATIASVALAAPLLSVYVARFLALFESQTPPRTSCGKTAARPTKRPASRILQTWRRLSTWGAAHPIKAFLTAWLAMFVLWLPYFLAFWPSVWAFDTHSQTHWVLEGTLSINAWHPPLHTLWLSLPVAASKALFDSYVPGAAFYTITQMLALSSLLTGIIRILARWRVPRVLPPAIWFIFALFPVFGFWSVVATKDVIFSGLFALSCACLADLVVRKDPPRPRGARYFTLLWLLLMLTALFRNNAAYGFALFAILLLAFGGKLPAGRVKSATFVASVVVAWFVITGPVYTALGVTPIQSREMMSVPAQQLATVAQQGKGVSDGELAFIEKYVPDHAKLKENIADPVKKNFNTDETKADPLKFVKGYLKIGLAHPVAYANAFFRIELAFLSPLGDDMTSAESTSAYVKNREKWSGSAIVIDESSLAPALEEAATAFLKGDAILCTPLASVLWQGGFWLWVALLLLVLCHHLKERGIVFVLVFILCYWATVCVGPVAIFRYVFPLVCCAPLLVSLFFHLKARPADF